MDSSASEQRVALLGARLGSARVVRDRNGDGADEILIAWQEAQFCGSGSASGGLVLLDPKAGKSISLLNGWERFQVDAGARADLDREPMVLLGNAYARPSWVQLRAGLLGEVLFEIPRDEERACYSARLLGDADGDGRADLGLGNAWAHVDTADGLSSYTGGRFSVVSSSTGETLWSIEGSRSSEGVGSDSVGVEDLDQDQVSDVLILVTSPSGEHAENRLELRSGASGTLLCGVALNEPGYGFGSLEQAGDLDGDGSGEALFVPYSSDPAGELERVFSPRLGRFIDRDLGIPPGDSRLIPVIGRSSASQPGLLWSAVHAERDRGKHLLMGGRWIDLELSGAPSTGQESVAILAGDFNGDGLWDLFELERPAASWDRNPIYRVRFGSTPQ